MLRSLPGGVAGMRCGGQTARRMTATVRTQESTAAQHKLRMHLYDAVYCRHVLGNATGHVLQQCSKECRRQMYLPMLLSSSSEGKRRVLSPAMCLALPVRTSTARTWCSPAVNPGTCIRHTSQRTLAQHAQTLWVTPCLNENGQSRLLECSWERYWCKAYANQSRRSHVPAMPLTLAR